MFFVAVTITKNVQNAPPAHGHRHEVANTTGDGVVNDALLQVAPHVNQRELQFVDVLHFPLVNLGIDCHGNR